MRKFDRTESARHNAYDAGYLAAMNMVSINRCPYGLDHLRQAWFDGYNDAEQETGGWENP